MPTLSTQKAEPAGTPIHPLDEAQQLHDYIDALHLLAASGELHCPLTAAHVQGLLQPALMQARGLLRLLMAREGARH